jgi:hypothetical protein
MQWASIWLSTKGAFSKAWAAIKKLPHWALVCGFFLVAAVWYFMQRAATSKKLLKVQKKVSLVEKEHADEIAEIGDVSRREEKKIRAAHEEKLKVLKDEEDELKNAEVKGPVAIANEWSEFLLKRKKKNGEDE